MKITRLIAAALSMTFLLGTSAGVNNYILKNHITANAEETSVEVKYALGDVNNDGSINAVDVSSVLSHYALTSTAHGGGFNEEQLTAADVNLDGSVDAVDASCILAYYAYASTTTGDIVSIAEFIRSRANKEEETPVLGCLSAKPHYIYINTEETVKFTVRSAESFPKDTVSLYDENNNFVSYMFDDGTNGDEKANDGIYSKDIVLSSADFNNVKYYAADKYKSDKRNICFYRDLTDDDMDGFLDILDDMDGFTFEEACTFIKNSDKVRSYSIDEENSSIKLSEYLRISRFMGRRLRRRYNDLRQRTICISNRRV